MPTDVDLFTFNGLLERGFTSSSEPHIVAFAAVTFFPTLVRIKSLTRKQIHNPPFPNCIMRRDLLPKLEIRHTRIGNCAVAHHFSVYRLHIIRLSSRILVGKLVTAEPPRKNFRRPPLANLVIHPGPSGTDRETDEEDQCCDHPTASCHDSKIIPVWSHRAPAPARLSKHNFLYVVLSRSPNRASFLTLDIVARMAGPKHCAKPSPGFVCRRIGRGIDLAFGAGSATGKP